MWRGEGGFRADTFTGFGMMIDLAGVADLVYNLDYLMLLGASQLRLLIAIIIYCAVKNWTHGFKVFPVLLSTVHKKKK